MPGTVLVPVDLATHAEEVGLAACQLAGRLGARVVAMHVVNLGGLASNLQVALPEHGGPAPLGDIVTEDARKRLAPLREKLEATGVEVQIALRHGDVVKQIWDCAQEVAADYVVIGSDIPAGLRRLLPVGSYTQAVLREACCPVVVVKAIGPAAGRSAVGEQVAVEKSDG